MADKHDLVDLSVHEVSLVDSPANKGARVMLFKRGEAFEREGDPADVEAYLKREFSDDKRKELADSGAALPDGSYPIESVADLKNAIRAYGRAKDKAKTKAHIESRARALGQTDLIPDGWEGGAADKRGVLKRVLDLFGVKVGKDAADGDPPKSFDDLITAQALQPKLWDAWSALQCAICSIVEHAPEGEKEALLQASLDEFKTYIQDLVAGAVGKSTGAPSGDDPMATAALKKSLGLPETATDADVEKAVTEQGAALAKARSEAAVAKMSQAHKDYADAKGMSGDALDNFAAKSPAERDAHIESHPLEKRGDAVAELQKRFDAELKKRDDEIADLRKSNEIAEITKRMEALPYAGNAAENARLIYDLGKSDKSAAERLEKSFQDTNERLAKSELFSERGSALKAAGSAAAAVEKAAEELQKSNPSWSIQKARTEARRQNKELANKEKEEQREAQKAAQR